MQIDTENAPSSGVSASQSERMPVRSKLDRSSPYAIAQDGLAQLVGAAVQAQRDEAMNAAMQVDVVFLTVSYAQRAEHAFVASKLSPNAGERWRAEASLPNSPPRCTCPNAP